LRGGTEKRLKATKQKPNEFICREKNLRKKRTEKKGQGMYGSKGSIIRWAKKTLSGNLDLEERLERLCVTVGVKTQTIWQSSPG